MPENNFLLKSDPPSFSSIHAHIEDIFLLEENYQNIYSSCLLYPFSSRHFNYLLFTSNCDKNLPVTLPIHGQKFGVNAVNSPEMIDKKLCY